MLARIVDDALVNGFRLLTRAIPEPGWLHKIALSRSIAITAVSIAVTSVLCVVFPILALVGTVLTMIGLSVVIVYLAKYHADTRTHGVILGPNGHHRRF